ncbi:PREDICTED: mannose-6-phosphate isomerase 2-like isoform X3 [Camelina sativa]|uniref:Mannose-6-phosphate isomerase n=1 Tax=Camelina sativa TaxID=90675 RepID=A0ABM0WG34_CAMSA|nr:PREDICTED: mannose-6-phosphate isomerase 2-like isoform X3 [Camelina sativa]
MIAFFFNPLARNTYHLLFIYITHREVTRKTHSSVFYIIVICILLSDSSATNKKMGADAIQTNGHDQAKLLTGGEKIQRLRCFVKNYEWGKLGPDSLVARLQEANSGGKVDAAVPHAEFWMGTHESGPSHVEFGSGQNEGSDNNKCMVTLKSWVLDNPDSLGSGVVGKWGCDLPFLFKVLSVTKALSIQAHPNKALAEKLHREEPLLYRDNNHKPEIALAVTPFQALCGFVSLKELKEVITNVPEITELVGSKATGQIFKVNEHDEDVKVKLVVRLIFTQLMSASSSETKQVVSRMKIRLISETKHRELSDKEKLVLELEEQYKGDIGVISAFFFNYVKLNPGEALYLDANEPHAYISGDCVECMAASDNVVRAGLTPKHRDVQTLCSMLTYKLGYPEILKGFPLTPYVTRYLPPFDEFEVDHCDLPRGKSTVFPAVPGPSVYLVIEGEGKLQTGSTQLLVSQGDVLFVPAHNEIHIHVTGESDLMKLYRAGVSSRFFQTL